MTHGEEPGGTSLDVRCRQHERWYLEPVHGKRNVVLLISRKDDGEIVGDDKILLIMREDDGILGNE